MQFYVQPLPLGRFPMSFRQMGQWITFRSVLRSSIPYLIFCHFDHFPSAVTLFLLPSCCFLWCLSLSIKCGFRTLVQETNLNCDSKPSRFAGAEFRQSRLSWRAVFLGWERQGRTEVQSWQLPGAQKGGAAMLFLSAAWAVPSPVPLQCVWIHVLVAGRQIPRDLLGKEQNICWGIHIFFSSLVPVLHGT